MSDAARFVEDDSVLLQRLMGVEVTHIDFKLKKWKVALYAEGVEQSSL